MNPPISVVMSCFNEAARLRDAVNSILNQTYSNFEFILIDDGSDDGTFDLLEAFENRDGRIKLLRNETNIGLAASLNRGIRAAQGKYIARMDADDRSLPDRFEKQLAFLTAHPEVDVLGTAVEKIDPWTGNAMGIAKLPPMHHELISRVFIKPLVYHPTIMAKKSVFYQYGFYDESISWGEDADLWYRIYDKITFHNLDEPLLIYSTKKRLSAGILYHNLRNKVRHLQKRQALLKHIPVLLKDLLTGSFRMIKNY